MNRCSKTGLVVRHELMNYWPFLLFFLAWVAFPSHNPTIDSLGYAADIKAGKDLFRPHHLLFNATGYFLWSFVGKWTMLSTLRFLQLLNAMVGLMSLFVFRRLLLSGMDRSISTVNGYLLLVGASFGVWRFASDNEAYLFPLFFALLGTFYFVLFLKETKNNRLLMSGVLFSLAALFHQIYFFWWLGVGLILWIYWRKQVWFFLLPALMVPVVYVLVFYGCKPYIFGHAGNIFEFLLYDYLKGGAEFSINRLNFILTPISLFRTFFDLHGRIFFLIKTYLFVSVTVFVGCFILAIRTIRELRQVGLHTKSREGFWVKPFSQMLILVFLLHLGFAFLSHGNAEFMTMLPFILCLYLSLNIHIPRGILFKIGLICLIWNFTFGILPRFYFTFYDNSQIVSFAKQHPDAVFVLADAPGVASLFYYNYGYEIEERLFSGNLGEQSELLEYQQKGCSIYSDLITRTEPLNRGTFTQSLEQFIPLEAENNELPLQSLYGDYYLQKVRIESKID